MLKENKLDHVQQVVVEIYNTSLFIKEFFYLQILLKMTVLSFRSNKPLFDFVFQSSGGGISNKRPLF